MIPKMTGIDHVHVYVKSREKAAVWYQQILGFRVLEEFRIWATEVGPLTIEDSSGNVHLALFKSKGNPQTTIAFGATASEFLNWIEHLESHQLTLRITDHNLSYSLYFYDPDDNMHEITTYDHQQVRQHLKK